ncbi:hypothetical protein SAMD00023353_5400550 [Rosellinia necatrix]|uniref:Uncharacterized protein n=1 Tax=Rosellinia necatrix TaxID=77044 RepID=A0A1S8A9V9_ROSNE|nr:hypothetical protein SAMD00023353_5400550 [Rosellinia necatrix]
MKPEPLGRREREHHARHEPCFQSSAWDMGYGLLSFPRTAAYHTTGPAIYQTFMSRRLRLNRDAPLRQDITGL